MITPRNITRHELIGLEVRVSESTDPTMKGIHGRVIDETRNTLTIEVSGKHKLVPKGISTFRFTLDGTVVEVRGSALVGRPQDRIKK